jgi:ArsR family transcriptional regulator
VNSLLIFHTFAIILSHSGQARSAAASPKILKGTMSKKQSVGVTWLGLVVNLRAVQITWRYREDIGATPVVPVEDHTAVDPVTTCQVRSPSCLKILPEDREMIRLARAMAHPARVAIVCRLPRLGECVCTDLSGVVPLAHSTAMQHIKILKESGLLLSSRDGRNVLCCMNPEVLRRLKGLVGGL